MIVYSSLFARWAWVVKPQNLLLSACHVSNVFAQINQMRRAVNYKIEKGEEEEVYEIGKKAAGVAVGIGGVIIASPVIRNAVVSANLGPVSTFAGAAAGPFTVHFWAPMSKWLISGSSTLHRHYTDTTPTTLHDTRRHDMRRNTTPDTQHPIIPRCLLHGPGPPNGQGVHRTVLSTDGNRFLLLPLRDAGLPHQLPPLLCQHRTVRQLSLAPRTQDQGGLHRREEINAQKDTARLFYCAQL